ncbi:hypothetical protein A8C56_13630 [Niabella ginsenosidivorans]|uniref:Uncharacterized protein n=1 Tax=Niabella ginsenosidivorans TaxID=1176587 RepID=A0A1A9I3H2_9BACT|nr:hypothetical protein [Niabella ginsenosidivorans]ANH81875.1 hypothetical protein A8C56_13630 [Niabella ginsenosidivorans]
MIVKQIPGVPEQVRGGYHDTESSRCFENEENAYQEFSFLKQRFLNINRWKEYAGEGSADFCLYNSEGNPVERPPVAGDYIRIDIPGPGNIEAKGFDWVQVKKISTGFLKENEKENMLIECSPSIDPTQPDPGHIAHFYSEDATSTFMISKDEKCIYACIYGRNEQPNFKNAGIPDKIRNSLIAIGGIAGISKMEWKALTEGLLKER